MIIQVPFHLRRRSFTEPATALLVPSRDPGVLMTFCARLGVDPGNRVFDVAGGFLLVLERPTQDAMPGAVRLRAVAGALYVPVDAELVPALLDDEANGLVRDWGLVFPPGGDALLFDRHAPVASNELFHARPRARRGWSSFPAPRPLADRLVEIAFEQTDTAADEIYRNFQQGMKDEPGRTSAGGDHEMHNTGASEQGATPPTDAAGEPTAAGESSPGRTGDGHAVLGSVAAGFRAFFAQAGQTFEALRDKAQWEWVDHSHLLRKLLREFRDGDPARALRRAVPIAPAGPSVPTRLARLPWMRAIYNLSDLLRPVWPGRGETSAVLPAEPSLVTVLAQEYRKAAQRAAEQGDFRRAAYIHGFLLGDDRKAAVVLQRGGLHHDAAMLYLKKLNDPAAAAQAFEAAGEVDRAIELYRQTGRHEAAGDLLRRIGEEDAAIAEYAAAAAVLSGLSPPDYLAAGRLWLQKVRKPEPAIEAFRHGWAHRPEGNAALCALELARFHAERGALAPIVTLVDEADALFEVPGQPYNGFFYNELTRLALLPSMQSAADDLRDRVLESMARKLRQGVERGEPAAGMVSALLGKSRLWPTPLVSDAEFAATAELRRGRARAVAPAGETLVSGTQTSGIVTALCQAAMTGEVFLGFASGRVISFRTERNQLVTVAENDEPVAGLAVDPDGKTLVVLCLASKRCILSCLRRAPDGSFRRRHDRHFSTGTDCWLTSILPWGMERLVGMGEGRELLIVDAFSGLVRQRVTIAGETWSPPATAILLTAGSTLSGRRLMILTHDGPRWVVCDTEGIRRTVIRLGWQPGIPGSSSLRSVQIRSRFIPPCLDLLGLDTAGAVHAMQFHAEDGSFELVAERVASVPGGYLAAAHGGPNRVVAIASRQIDWLDASSERFSVAQTVNISLDSAVACFHSPSTREVVVVCSDGFIARAIAPRRPSVIRG